MAGDPITLADKAYAELEHRIVTLELKPGEIVTEKDVSDKLGIGRMPVRLAFKRLEGFGLVSSLPRKGVLINEIKVEDVFLQLEVRLVLERLLVARACRFASAAERKELLELADHYEEATRDTDRDKAISVDDQFNKLLGQCSKNDYAWKAIVPFHVLSRRFYFYNYEMNEDLTREINQTHIDLMRAIAVGKDADALAKVNYLHGLNEKLVLSAMSIHFPMDGLLNGTDVNVRHEQLLNGEDE